MTNNTKLVRAGVFGALLLASSALTAPALAQTLPRYNQADSSGVDLVTGGFFFSLPEGSIGSGEGALSLMRNWAGSAGWTDNWGGKFIRSGSQLVFEFGTYSDLFTLSGSTWTADKGDGATLVPTAGSASYMRADGTQIDYAAESPAGNTLVIPGCSVGPCGIPVRVQRPNGMVYTLTYDYEDVCLQEQDGACNHAAAYYRLRGVSNSANYAFTISYVTDNAGGGTTPVANWYVRTGAQFTNLDTAPASLPTVTYSPVSSTVLDVTDTGGLTWRLTTGATAIGIRRPGSSTDDVSATLSGGLVTQVVRDGVTTGYSRSVSGSTITTTVTEIDGDAGTTDPQTVVVADSSIGRVTSITDPLSRQTSFAYDGNGRPTLTTQPEGNSVGYTYDARGNVTEVRLREKDDSSDTGDDIVTTASFDSSCTNVVTCNQPNSVTDARGFRTDFTYDSTHGGIVSVTRPAASGNAPVGSGDRPQTRYSYTQVTAVTGQPVYLPTAVSACASGTVASSCVGTTSEARTVIAYDTDNLRVTSVTRRNGDNSLSAAGALTYDATGNLLTVDGPLSGTADTMRYRYDAGRLVGVVGPDPDGGGALHHRAQRITYTNGLPTKQERGTVNSQSDGDWTSFSSLEEMQQAYDSHGRPSVQRLVSGGTTYALTQASYDLLGRQQCVAQRMNPSEFASLPSDACTLDTEGSYGADRITRTSYNAAGQIALVQTGYGVSGVQADEVALTYTANGRTETVTDAESNRTTYVYDGFDRLSRMRMPHPSTDNTSSTTDYEDYAYDAAGNLTSRRVRSSASIGYSYDNLNRLTARDLPSSPWWNIDRAYTYDLLGRLLSADGNGTSSYAYDGLGRLTSETGYFGAVSYQYDAAGQRTALIWPDTLYMAYDYNVAGDLLHIRENGAASGAGVLATYTWDDRGRRTLLTRGNGTSLAYSYDNVSRLTGLTDDLSSTTYDQTITLTRNPAGEIASTTRSNDAYAWGAHYAVTRAYTANGLNQYTASGAVTPTYDTNGNLTSAGGATYDYNAENRLVVSSAATHMETIDDSSDRLFRYFDGAANRWFVYDGNQLIAETNTGGTAWAHRYVFNPGTGEPLLWYDGSTRRYLHGDERGSIVAITDGNGAATTINSYDEYGIPGASNTGRFQYTGQVWLPEVGLAYYRARFYSPTLGRFMQTDPIGMSGGMNLYAYVGNNPVNFTDPLGLRPKCVVAENGGQDGPPKWHCKEDDVLNGSIPGWYYSRTGVTINYDPGTGSVVPPAQPPAEHPACRTARQNAERGRDSLPYHNGENWNNVANLTYLRDLYQDRANSLSFLDGVAPDIANAVGSGGAAYSAGENARLALTRAGVFGVAAAFYINHGRIMLQNNREHVEVLNARLDYLRDCSQ